MFGFLFDEVDKDKNGSVTLEELKLKMQPAVKKHEIKHCSGINFFSNLRFHICKIFKASHVDRGYLVAVSFPSCTEFVHFGTILPGVFREILLRRNSHI